MYTKRLKATDPQPVVIDQQGDGYILKNLTEEEFWKLGRHRYYATLKAVNEQAKGSRSIV